MSGRGAQESVRAYGFQLTQGMTGPENANNALRPSYKHFKEVLR